MWLHYSFISPAEFYISEVNFLLHWTLNRVLSFIGVYYMLRLASTHRRCVS